MHQPLHDFGGSGPPLHLAVANGFPPATYAPFVIPLLARHRVFSLPPRALWPGIGAPPAQAGSWTTLADDLLAGWDANGIDRLAAVGHSYGGVASLLAAVRQPERFEALVLLDPTIMAPSVMEQIAELRRRGETARFAMVDGARRRRDRFGSVEEAYEFWRSKSLFERWPDETLRLYVRSMTRPAADGDGLELAWSGEWEAHYYESFYAETWEDAARLSPQIPLLVIVGEASTTVSTESVAEMRRVWPWATVRTIPGHGHLFPQEMG
ncbi:MAG: alpha/beta hydrolase, partial [Gemmatimonadota bacterium]|nr:alpha/beta hydrolase [Gemmatimonadota bacterium]